MKCVDDFRLRLGSRELVPIIIGGMGVDISTAELALVASRLGGIGHISDAMLPTVTDRRYKTKFVSDKQKQYKLNIKQVDKSIVQFDLAQVAEATRLHVSNTMEAKRGEGMIFVNCMEKITLSAGLHLGSFEMMKDNPRFRDARLGIIVSSLRALILFMRKTARLERLPDFIVVEGPLAGGHLGFGMDWAQYDLHTIVAEIIAHLKAEHLDIPVIAAGGIFTGTDAVDFMEHGCAAVQVATRFTVSKECGIPEKVQQEYFKATEDQMEVNTTSPTGYPMRMISTSPSIGAGIRPNCEAYGYLLDGNGGCAYIDAYNRVVAENPEAKKISVMDKTCLCTHMRNYDCWTCGHYTYRLKDTTHRNEDGTYQILSAEHIFHDYQFSKDNKLALPAGK
jgi:nitronate monooxygenase